MIIKDPVLNPFHIEIGNGNHTVLKSTGKVDKEQKPIYSTIGYYSDMESSLKAIVKEKVIENNKGSIMMLKDYIEECQEISESITNILK